MWFIRSFLIYSNTENVAPALKLTFNRLVDDKTCIFDRYFDSVFLSREIAGYMQMLRAMQ